MTRLGLVVGLLVVPVAFGQPTTYTVPIVARTPVANSIPGTAPLTQTLILPPLPAALDQTLVFGVGGASSVPFLVSTGGSTTVPGMPATVDAIATAPGVLINGALATVMAVSSGGTVFLGTLTTNTFVPQDAGVNIPATTLMAMTASPDGGAALFVSDGSNITRWDIDGSGTTLVARQGLTITATPTSGGGADTPRVLAVDGLAGNLRGVGFVGGGTLGDVYSFDAQLDAGNPTAFDIALTSQGRLGPSVTGMALMQGPTSDYLLVANGNGLTVYDLTKLPVGFPATQASAFILRGADAMGTITAPIGVAATGLGISSLTPGGAIVVGNAPDRTLAILSWAAVADAGPDGGLVVVDAGYDPRQGLIFDGGLPADGGQDGGPDGGGGTPGGGDHTIVSPGIPVDNGGCGAVDGAPVVFPLLALLSLAFLLRLRRNG